jgi:hypothetical protein
MWRWRGRGTKGSIGMFRYIIFKNVENFKNYFFEIKKSGIFRKIPFAEMNFSKLINYSTDMC